MQRLSTLTVVLLVSGGVLVLLTLIVFLFGLKNPDLRYESSLDNGPWWLIVLLNLGRVLLWWVWWL